MSECFGDKNERVRTLWNNGKPATGESQGIRTYDGL